MNQRVKILETMAAPGRGPVGLAWDGRFLWNTDYSSSKIYRIDPHSGEHDVELVCPGNLSGLTWDGRSLWQSLHDGGTLRRINPETNDFDQTIMVHEHGWLSGVAWDGEHLCTVSQQHGKIFVLDRENGDKVREIPAPTVGGDLDFHNGALWLGLAYPMVFSEPHNHFEWAGDKQHFALVQIDPAEGREMARYDVPFLPMGLAWANEHLWMAHTAEGTLSRAVIE